MPGQLNTSLCSSSNGGGDASICSSSNNTTVVLTSSQDLTGAAPHTTTLAGLTNWPQLGVTASSTASLSEVIEGEHSDSPGKKPRPSGGLMEPTNLTEELKTNSLLQSRVPTNIYSQAPASLRAPPFPDPHFEEQKKHFSEHSNKKQKRLNMVFYIIQPFLVELWEKTKERFQGSLLTNVPWLLDLITT